MISESCTDDPFRFIPNTNSKTIRNTMFLSFYDKLHDELVSYLKVHLNESQISTTKSKIKLNGNVKKKDENYFCSPHSICNPLRVKDA